MEGWDGKIMWHEMDEFSIELPVSSGCPMAHEENDINLIRIKYNFNNSSI